MWSYTEKLDEILELTQSTIQSGIKSLVDDNWADPKAYDISITRSVGNHGTIYSVLGIRRSRSTPLLQGVRANPNQSHSFVLR
jgi:hypothetical protein